MNNPRSSSLFREYYLSFSDGCSWWLSGVNESAGWVDKFAAIMELRESRVNGSPKLIFSPKVASNGTINRASNCVSARLSNSGPNAGLSITLPESLRVWCHDNIPDVVCEVKDNDKSSEAEIINMWFALHPIYQRSMCIGGLPFHAALIELDGRGVLLAARGDTGKSTCCRRFPDYWKPLCDDEALVVFDRQKKYRAHPFPTWSDYLWKHSEKTWNVQYSIPLAGVFFLEQSEVDEIKPLGEGQAAVLMAESAIQVYRKFWRTSAREDKRPFRLEIFNNACKMAKLIPAYRLCVSLHGEFWKKMEQVIGR